MSKCHGRLEAFPPYVGGDDDEIDEWQPACDCGWTGKRTEHITVAFSDLVDHLNAKFKSGDPRRCNCGRTEYFPPDCPCQKQTTSRGFPAPIEHADSVMHSKSRLFVVRLSMYERNLLRPETSGVTGRFCLLDAGDGSHQLVRYADQ